MSIKPCKNTVAYYPSLAEYDVLKDLTKVEDFDKRWQKLFPKKQLTYAYRLTREAHPVHLLIEASVLEKIAFIPFLYKKENALLNLGDECGWTALHHAVIEDKFSAVEALLYLNADPNLSSIRSRTLYSKGTTSLDIALICRSVDIAALLLKFDAQSDGVDKRDQTVLFTALRASDMINTFYEAKAKLDKERLEMADQIDTAVRPFGIKIQQEQLLMIASYV